MLQRAASNAYSWWYASHVRTKQSKWLEQSLQDMGEKVEAVLKLIEEDGDSFAKRAEMYYKKRPELINFVEESYRAYRSLAERYDHLSKELQNANNTLASAFPDQYQYLMDDDDDISPKMPRRFQERTSNNPNIPQAPTKFPSKNIKAIIALTANAKKSSPLTNAPKSGAHANKLTKSGLTMSEAVKEIDKLQKQILTLQTEKEFAKSSYESGYAKYWDIDDQISGTQEKISKLQDEFEVAQVIEDDEARTLMAEAAIKSCDDTLSQLQQKQERATEEAKTEIQRIKNARDKLKSLKGEFQSDHDQTDALSEISNPLPEEVHSSPDDRTKDLDASSEISNPLPEEVHSSSDDKTKDLDLLRDKIKEHFDVGEKTSLTVLEMAEKIDELVNKVISLESSMSSQTALIHSLRSETDELQSQVKSLEDDKASLIAGKTTLSDKLGEMENKLRGLQDLNDSLGNQISSPENHSTESHFNIDIISDKSIDVKLNEGEPEESTSIDIKPDEREPEESTSLDIKPDEGEPEESTSLDIMEDEGKPEESTKSQESTGSTENEDVKNETVQDKQQCDISTLNFSQDSGENDQKASLTESTDEPLIPFKTDDIQAQQSKPSTIDIVHAQETSNNTVKEAGNTSATHIQQLATWVTFPQVESREVASMSNDEPKSPLSSQLPGERGKEEDEPDWQKLFIEGLQGKEKLLLAEYTTTLRNYKEIKKKLCEVEIKNEENFSEIVKQLTESKSSLSMKDEEIYSLRQKLSLLQKKLEEYKNSKENNEESSIRFETPEDDDDDIKVIAPGEEKEISPVEQKLRTEMDQILEENLDFWMRFSASFGQIQKFQNGVQDLQAELAKIEKKHEKKEGSSPGDPQVNSSLKSDIRPIYKHLREIQTELTVWLEQSEKLKEELQRRFSQLCHIQEEIQHALSAGAEDDDMKFTSFQAAKFQGEVANMQQENNKVADELQTGMDYITSLQLEVERTITRLNEELGLFSVKSPSENERSGNRARVPLRSFIFGVKPQKKKQSIFSCMHPGMMNRRYQHLRADKSP